MATCVVPLCRRCFPHSSPAWLFFFSNLGKRGHWVPGAGAGAQVKGEEGAGRPPAKDTRLHQWGCLPQCCECACVCVWGLLGVAESLWRGGAKGTATGWGE